MISSRLFESRNISCLGILLSIEALSLHSVVLFTETQDIHPLLRTDDTHLRVSPLPANKVACYSTAPTIPRGMWYSCLHAHMHAFCCYVTMNTIREYLNAHPSDMVENLMTDPLNTLLQFKGRSLTRPAVSEHCCG